MTRRDQEPHGCRYITGHTDTKDWHFCQAKQMPGKSWCREHDLIVYQQPEPPKADAA